VRPVGHGARLESTVFVGAAVPTTRRRGGIQSAPSVNVAGATGYASRAHYLWGSAGYEKRAVHDGDKWGDVGYYSFVYGYRPPALAFLLLAPTTASAELRRVQLNVLGMD